MPVVYGRSYRSLVDVITQWLRDDLQDFLTPEGIRVLELAQCLASEVNNVIKEAIPNCRELSRWLSKTATIQMDKGLRPYFFTPLGLGVETWATEGKQDVVELNLAGRRMKLSVRDKGTTIDRRRTCSSLCLTLSTGMTRHSCTRLFATGTCISTRFQRCTTALGRRCSTRERCVQS